MITSTDHKLTQQQPLDTETTSCRDCQLNKKLSLSTDTYTHLTQGLALYIESTTKYSGRRSVSINTVPSGEFCVHQSPYQ